MTLEEIVRLGLEQKASDIHLEPRVQLALRISGNLKRVAYVPSAEDLLEFTENLLTPEQIESFDVRGSVDLSKTISGVPCRINVLKSDRGVGLVLRLLSTASQSLKSCNLHPAIGEFLQKDSGLLILTGATGSGKSTTLTALLEEVNQHESRHIVTLESPIEYRLTPKKSMIRQREVGVHTPSFEQGLLDSLREDPDILVVGEMREAETIRLTLNAAETGHLVLATMHSSSAMEAVYRIMMSFPADRQSSVLAQVADSLVGIVSHKMTYRPSQALMVPCCEILTATHATRNVIRKGDVSKLPSILQAGGPDGMYSFERYQSWLDQKDDWVLPSLPSAVVAVGNEEATPARSLKRKRPSRPETPAAVRDEVSYDITPEPTDFPVRTRSEEAPRRRSAAPMIDTKPRDVSRDLTANVDRDTSEAEAEIMREIARAQSENRLPEMPAQKTRRGRGSGSTATKIHKDGRIEIPEMELDLDELVREFETKSKR